MVALFKTPDNAAEATAALPIDQVWRVVMQLDLGQIYAGDTFMAMAEVEFTNDIPNLPVGVFLQLTQQRPLAGFKDETLRYGEANGRNVIKESTHHDTHAKHGMLVIPAGKTDCTVCYLWARAVRTPALAAPVPSIKVEPGFGHLHVVRL